MQKRARAGMAFYFNPPRPPRGVVEQNGGVRECSAHSLTLLRLAFLRKPDEREVPRRKPGGCEPLITQLPQRGIRPPVRARCASRHPSRVVPHLFRPPKGLWLEAHEARGGCCRPILPIGNPSSAVLRCRVRSTARATYPDTLPTRCHAPPLPISRRTPRAAPATPCPGTTFPCPETPAARRHRQ